MSKKYQSGRLKIDFWEYHQYSGQQNLSQDFIDEYRKIGELKDRVYGQIRQINKILERREAYINIYREISRPRQVELSKGLRLLQRSPRPTWEASAHAGSAR